METPNRKVTVATLGAGAGTVVSDFVLWGMDQFWFEGTDNIPGPVAGFVYLVVTVLLTFVPSYLIREPVSLPVDPIPPRV